VLRAVFSNSIVDARSGRIEGFNVALFNEVARKGGYAVKFMGDQAAPAIEIGVEERGGESVLFVGDNGMGIDPAHQAKLFGLFEKLHSAIEGSGMGLAMTRRTVELHGGRIWLEPQGRGRATTLCVTLAGTRIGEAVA
jgi:signal transduction histidine kinase